MPDRFNFERGEIGGIKIGVARPRHRPTGPGPPALQAGVDVDEDEPDSVELQDSMERGIRAAALYAQSSVLPPDAAAVGPGLCAGPLRFLPPGKRVHLYWEFGAWCQATGHQPASLATFLRVLREAVPNLRIRKAGTHATCDACMRLKAAIREARHPERRQAAIETYTKHLLLQWMDRQVYWNMVSLSVAVRQALSLGQRFGDLARSSSQVCLIVDGIDQAKFRIPRILERSRGPLLRAPREFLGVPILYFFSEGGGPVDGPRPRSCQPHPQEGLTNPPGPSCYTPWWQPMGPRPSRQGMRWTACGAQLCTSRGPGPTGSPTTWRCPTQTCLRTPPAMWR
jgi:hypothetical protein